MVAECRAFLCASREQRSCLEQYAHYRCARYASGERGPTGARRLSAITAKFTPFASVSRSGRATTAEVAVRGCCAALLRNYRFKVEGRRHRRVKSFFELLGKAMQSTGMTLRLCLLMLIPAAAYVISQLK